MPPNSKLADLEKYERRKQSEWCSRYAIMQRCSYFTGLLIDLSAEQTALLRVRLVDCLRYARL